MKTELKIISAATKDRLQEKVNQYLEQMKSVFEVHNIRYLTDHQVSPSRVRDNQINTSYIAFICLQEKITLSPIQVQHNPDFIQAVRLALLQIYKESLGLRPDATDEEIKENIKSLSPDYMEDLEDNFKEYNDILNLDSIDKLDTIVGYLDDYQEERQELLSILKILEQFYK